MKMSIGCSVLLLAQFVFIPDIIADRNFAEQGALDSQSARLQAMIDVDIDTLEEYLADELTYAHTTGWTETKSEFLSTVESRTIDYVSATPRDVEIRIYEDIAVITGLSDMRGLVRGEPVSLTIRFLEVSIRAENIWRLVAWQSVRFSGE